MIGIIIPPADIKKLVQKTAEHVALNGSDFERILIQREQHKTQFAFLKPDSPYRGFYDHRVAQISKKLLQGMVPEQKMEEEKIQVPKTEIVVKEQAQTENKQNQLLQKIFMELKQPDPEKYIAELPEKLSEAQQAMIQHTAQYAAKNGKNFLVALTEREKNNPQFQFLRNTSKHNAYFTKLVQAYTHVIEMTEQQLQRLDTYTKNKEAIFQKCKQAYEYHLTKHQQTRGKKQTTKQPKDSNIDWNDFELVETITFDTDKNINGELLARIQQHASMVPKTMEEKIISEPKKRQILQQCHACRQNILASEMNKHLKTCLGQKKKNNANQSAQGEEVDIRKNLQSLSYKRPDIFGTQDNRITLRQEQAQKNEEKAVYDGQAANLTRGTGSIAMLHYQQQKIKQENANKQK